MTEVASPEARRACGAIHEAIIQAGSDPGLGADAATALAVRPVEILQARHPKAQQPRLLPEKGNPVTHDTERHPEQTDDAVAHAILQSCLDLGLDPKAAQKMADRAIAFRQRKRG